MHIAALACPLAIKQRHHDRHRQQRTGGHVRNGDSGAHRPATRLAGDRHQPGGALHDLINARTGGIGTILAETADRAVDKAWIDRPEVVPGDLQAVLYRRAHVLDHHVGALDQPEEGGTPSRGLQVEAHEALVAVQVLKVGTVAADDVAAIAGRIHGDDVRTPVGKVPHAGRPRARQRQVENAQAGQWQSGGDVGWQGDAPGAAGISRDCAHNAARLPTPGKSISRATGLTIARPGIGVEGKKIQSRRREEGHDG